MDRRASVALAVTIVLLAGLVSPGGPQGYGSSEENAQDVQSDPVLDIDRDRLLDALDALVDPAADGDTFKVIVRMTSAPTPQTMGELEAAVGAFTVTSNKGDGAAEGSFWTLIPAFAAELTKTQILALADRADVKHVANAAKGADVSINTSRYSTGVNVTLNPGILNLSGDLDGEPYSFSQNDTVVCVIDTGVQVTHPSFAADAANSSYTYKYARNPPTPDNVWWKDFSALNVSAPEDIRGHGTSMASIVAGHDRTNMTNSSDPGSAPYLGVAPGAALVVVRGAPTGVAQVDLQSLIDGVHWCAGQYNGNQGPDFVDVISGSWGINTIDCIADDPDLMNAVDAAIDSGIVGVFAAGNDGPAPCTIHEPSVSSKAISVGMASDPLSPSCSVAGAPDPLYELGGGWYLNTHSSRGNATVVKPDILAPGVCIKSADADTPSSPGQGYQEASGTSPAAAFVAGVVALMLDITGHKANVSGGLTPAQVRQILIDTSVAPAWGPAGLDPEFGAGVINARAAVTKACTTVFTDATNRTNICKTDSAGNPVSPNTDPSQPWHENRTQTLAESTVLTGPKTDKWTLSITDTSWPISLTLITAGWPTSVFHVKLGDHTGSSSNVTRQETITPVYPAGTGDWTIEVTNPLGLGGTYWLDVSAGGTLALNPWQDQ